MSQEDVRRLKGGYASFDDMTWPLPDSEAENALRNGSPTAAQQLKAASILSAYSALIWETQENRNRRVKHIRIATGLDDPGAPED
jgi:hypothetical protein